MVVHPGDPSPSTSYLRDTEFRIVSDVAYLIPIPSNLPLKLAAMLGGRGLSIYQAVKKIRSYICHDLMKADNNNVIKILVVCNDEFSMMSVQLLHQILDLDTDKFKVGKVRI